MNGKGVTVDSGVEVVDMEEELWDARWCESASLLAWFR